MLDYLGHVFRRHIWNAMNHSIVSHQVVSRSKTCRGVAPLRLPIEAAEVVLDVILVSDEGVVHKVVLSVGSQVSRLVVVNGLEILHVKHASHVFVGVCKHMNNVWNWHL